MDAVSACMHACVPTLLRVEKKKDTVMGRAKKLATKPKPKPKPIGSFAGFGTKKPGTTSFAPTRGKGAWIVWVPTIQWVVNFIHAWKVNHE